MVLCSLCMIDLSVFCLLVFMSMVRERRFGILCIIPFEILSNIEDLVLRPGFGPGSSARKAGILDRTILPERYMSGYQAEYIFI